MKRANLGRISILVLLFVMLVACNGGEMESAATPPPEDTPMVEMPDTESTATATDDTSVEDEVEAGETDEVDTGTPLTPTASRLTAVIVSGDTAGIGKPFTFDATQSSAGDAAITNYVWTMGDGTTMFGISVEHAYSDPGFYTVTLIVTDVDGQTDTAAKVVEIVELEQLETPAAEGESTLAGTTWKLSNAMRGTTITLAFDEATLSGAAGCNDFEAAYTISEDETGEMTIERISATNFSCTPEVMAQESGYLDSLASARTFIYEGNGLVIETEEGTLTFVR